jgi:hypothetical protein
VKCPNCSAEQNIGSDCDDFSDRQYLLQCPEIRQYVTEQPSQDPGAATIDCPHMARARDVTVREAWGRRLEAWSRSNKNDGSDEAPDE